MEKVNVHNLWRASQKDFRWWASTEHLEITLDMISSSYKVGVPSLFIHQPAAVDSPRASFGRNHVCRQLMHQTHVGT